MKKLDKSKNIKKTHHCDFLIIGSGIAGLYTALKLSTIGKTIILTKEQLEDSNTQYAQGGIAAVLDKGDSWQLHYQDTLDAGAGLCKEKAVEVLVKEGPGRVKELIEMGTKFDHIEGELDLTREGAHSKRRILHARGDATGVEIRESLSRVINNREGINLKENTFMIDLILNKSGDKVKGVVVLQNSEYHLYLAQAVVIASGGCSRVYANTSNPDVTTGDGIAAAYRAGAEIMDMEFIQFHPTTLYNPEGSSFLISESVRGEGGLLINAQGERFMPEYHPLAELAPRDVVARAIVEEAEKDGRAYVFLDVTHMNSKFITDRFPTIYNTLKNNGYDFSSELIPVVPAAHYLMGGIKTDTKGRTNIKNLYACGEAACTGVHGANRLASNSLLEGLVFGHRIFKDISQLQEGKSLDDKMNESEELVFPFYKPYGTPDIDLETIRREFRKLMMEKAGIEREYQNLYKMLEWINEKLSFLNEANAADQRFWELYNMIINGQMIVCASMQREESRGGHYRVEFPERKKEWSKAHVLFNINNSKGKKEIFKDQDETGLEV